MSENQVLQSIRHPFIINMDYAFQDKENLYLIIKHCQGGDLRFHLIQKRTFTEEQTKFFVACLILSLEYLQRKNIIHRDLKPENFVLDSRGYLFLTDFGIAKYWRSQNSENTSGTPGYMSPEVLCHKNHSFSADYYALGIFVHECASGKRPHVGKNRKEIADQVMARQAVLKQSMVIGRWSDEAIDFCNGLIQRKRDRRLGEAGIHQLKNHPWFKDYDWCALIEQRVIPDFAPDLLTNNFDKKNIMKPEEMFEPQDLAMLKNPEVQNLFKDYNFNAEKVFTFEKTGTKKDSLDTLQFKSTNTS